MEENRKTPQEYMKQYLIQVKIPVLKDLVEKAESDYDRESIEKGLATAKKILWEECRYDYDQKLGIQSFENEEITDREREIGRIIYDIVLESREDFGYWEEEIVEDKEELLEKYDYNYDEEMKTQNSEEERGDNMALDDKLKGTSTAPESEKTEKEGKSKGRYEINLLKRRLDEIGKEISQRLKKQNLNKDELNLLKQEQALIKQERANIKQLVDDKLKREISEADKIIKSREGYSRKEKNEAYYRRDEAYKEINRIEIEALQRVNKKLEEIYANRTIKKQAESTGKAGENAETPEPNKPEEKNSQSPKKNSPAVEPQEEAKNSTQNEQPSATKIDEEILRLEEELKKVAGRRAEAKTLGLDFEEMIYRSRYTELVERIHKLNSQKQQIEIQNKIAEKEQELNVLYQEVDDKKTELNSLYAQLKGKKIVQEPPKQEPPKQEPPEQQPPEQEPPEQEPPKPKSPQTEQSREGVKSTPPIKKESGLAKIGKGLAGFLGEWMMRFATLGSGIKNIWNKFWNWMNKETDSPQQRNIFSTPTIEFSEEEKGDLNQIMSELTDVFIRNGNKGEEVVVGERAGEETQGEFGVGTEDNEPKGEEEVESEKAGEETQDEFGVENGKLKNVKMPDFLHGYKSEEVEDIETENEEEEVDGQGIDRKSRWKEWKEKLGKPREAKRLEKEEQEKEEQEREEQEREEQEREREIEREEQEREAKRCLEYDGHKFTDFVCINKLRKQKVGDNVFDMDGNIYEILEEGKLEFRGRLGESIEKSSSQKSEGERKGEVEKESVR